MSITSVAQGSTVEEHAPEGFRIVEEDGRIDAVDPSGDPIVGAFRPADHNYWLLYISTLVTKLIGAGFPHHAAFWGKHDGHDDARQWVEVIAALYVKAAAS